MKGLLTKLSLLTVSLLIVHSNLVASCLPEYSIALVHIGDKPPAYLTTAIAQARLFNRECPIYLLVSENAFPVLRSQAEKYNLSLIALENLTKTHEHELFSTRTIGQKPFNLYTKERFLYLYDFIAQNNLNNVFHIENDNMLYTDLSQLMPHFTYYYKDKIGITFSNDKKGIAGFMYIAHASSLKKLARFFSSPAAKARNDMKLLGFLREAEKWSIMPLPIIMDEYVKWEELKSPKGHTSHEPFLYCAYSDCFNSIFDANLHGAYLGGTDPHYKNAGPGFLDEYCVVNASRLNYIWERDEQGRNIPFVYYKKKKYRINNLHIHSKKLSNFSSL